MRYRVLMFGCARGIVATAVVLACTIGAASGCAHRVLIQSEPAGARIFVDGQLEGESPVVVERSSSSGGRMRVTAQLENFETSESIVEADDWFIWPALLAVTPLIGVPFVVVPVAGPFITCGWACATSPLLFSLAFLRKYPDEVTVRMRPRFGGGMFLPTDSWMIPDDVDPNPSPLPLEVVPIPKKKKPAENLPPQPEGANPPPLGEVAPPPTPEEPAPPSATAP